MSDKPTLTHIVRQTPRFFLLPDKVITAVSMRKDYAHVRQILCFVARDLYGYGASEIGRAIARNNSTVIHAAAAISERIKTEPRLEAIVDEVAVVCQEPLLPAIFMAPPTVRRLLPPPKLPAEVAPVMVTPTAVEEIQRLRRLQWSVEAIVKRTGYDEMLVAKVCGLPLWRGKVPAGSGGGVSP